MTRQAAPETCKWEENDDGYYETECNRAFFFETGTVSENNAHYCIFCGKLIEDVPYTAVEQSETCEWTPNANGTYAAACGPTMRGDADIRDDVCLNCFRPITIISGRE